MTKRQPSPRYIASRLDAETQLPEGKTERFSGYGVMGLPFDSGHILALRHFPASSIGPGYSSVWHRTPRGAWTFYSDVAPRQACARFFGRGIERIDVTPIDIDWTGPTELIVTVPAAPLEWSIRLAATPATRALNMASRLLPEALWRNRAVLSLMGKTAASLLDLGKVGLHGRAPNGQAFIANPRALWLVDESVAVLGGEELGRPAPREPQARLGDFWIPNRGVFAFGQTCFERLDPDRHATATSAAAAGTTAPA
ncbi:MAG: hypothetical protein GWN99_17750 [Gemmatimonadetes bacterium]|uniref:Uncharacterized protein n=1 Tax=Candidatus Kutchimonas denitrificans TaxID=3056748 RepID=A0AAE5C932_9BACT|nr:hypothetical protein [Gemmatimonadota bacterium]NIR75061.1 hypothetical protein [Candidatus Kutchimonas denitrificans]NIS02881.1 hypothetical protein [Gemmatimonadota bacterium]NIT68590.1 hypothetical protein [Gemmatimonadota bacterium]NIU52850.1 hypothetical protein [Gemmatimonadota bacterium]